MNRGMGPMGAMGGMGRSESDGADEWDGAELLLRFAPPPNPPLASLLRIGCSGGQAAATLS